MQHFSGAKLDLDWAGYSRLGRLHADWGDPNQDCYGVESVESAGAVVLGVFDGHGKDGEKISQFARTEILERCKRELESGKGASETLSVVFGEVSQLIDGDDDSTESGSTATVLIVQDHRIVSGFLGDSSASFCNLDAQSQVLDSGFFFEPHRTSNRKEARRILEFGCIIEEGYVVDPENKDNAISITRTFGDRSMRGCGVNSEAEISEPRSFDQNSIALVIATDGLWDLPKVTAEGVSATLSRMLRSGSDLVEIVEQFSSFNGYVPTDDCTVLIATVTAKTP
ncbi:hypothetical protein NDN08_007455 [Rhodosorus marinus]|uniref:PPM-type phosphatase domain-containing protein n=1 Tax=Rhodosorus marinus TaxID=101924 RepID=A0AAV8UXL3_9RHOD|nr:hypothetical protein NDN08_007455 [Rhodosorus marinus]